MFVNIFKPVPVEKAVREQLYEARRLALTHEAAAEHHDALATMYQSRIERLEALEAARALSVVTGR